MDFTEIDRLFSEAAKVLHLDASHSALQGKLQAHLSAEHRKANASADSSSYYDTPYVRDVYGSEEAGHIVHSKNGKLTMSKFKSDGKGGYALSDHKSVKQAYVADKEEMKESFALVVDGRELMVSESASELVEGSGVIEFQESAARSSGANARIRLITSGKGSMGYYTEAALKQAVKDNVFGKDTQMFLNHQTMQERLARPEGDITKHAGNLTGPAEYVEASGSEPAYIAAPAKIYPEFKPFIAARKDDIGVSVRVKAIPTGMKDGVPLVESFIGAISADFVTKAGRGGKIEELYESYRESNPGSGIQPQETAMTEDEKKILADLSAKVDRLQESNLQLLAESKVDKALLNSGLKPRGQTRVRNIVLATLPMTTTGALDETKLQEAIKAAVTDEVAYLQESGVQSGQPVVRHLGPVQVQDKDGKELSEADQLAAAEKMLQESVKTLSAKGAN